MDFKEKPFMTAGYYFKTRAEADSCAKKRADAIKSDIPVWKAVALVKYPVPKMEIEELA